MVPAGPGAVSLGIAQGALGAAVAHDEREKLEHLDQALADLPRSAGGSAARRPRSTRWPDSSPTSRAAWERGDPAVPILSAKASANEMAIRVTSEAMQACGGAALSSSLPLERFFRDARAGSVMAPTTDVLYELTGRALAGMLLM